MMDEETKDTLQKQTEKILSMQERLDYVTKQVEEHDRRLEKAIKLIGEHQRLVDCYGHKIRD